jgi:6,7-dimethyl-8-ribityllumazine synthase
VSKLKDVELLIEKPIGFGIIGPGITKALAQERIESYAKHAAQTVIKQLKNVESVKC